MQFFIKYAILLAEISIFMKNYMARAIYEQKESCEAAVLRMGSE